MEFEHEHSDLKNVAKICDVLASFPIFAVIRTRLRLRSRLQNRFASSARRWRNFRIGREAIARADMIEFIVGLSNQQSDSGNRQLGDFCDTRFSDLNIHSFILKFIYSLSNSLIRSFSNSFSNSLTHSQYHSLTHSPIRLPSHPLIHPFQDIKCACSISNTFIASNSSVYASPNPAFPTSPHRYRKHPSA